MSDLAEHLRVSENTIEELEFESSNGSEGDDSSVEELLYKSGGKNEENSMKPASNDNQGARRPINKKLSTTNPFTA